MSADYDALFRKYLLRVQEETNLIPDDQEVESRYLTNRTTRKTAVTRLERAGFADEFMDRINRWRAQEQSKGRFVRRRMNAHYAKAMLLAPMTWLCSYFIYKVGETELVTLPGKGRRVRYEHMPESGGASRFKVLGGGFFSPGYFFEETCRCRNDLVLNLSFVFGGF